MAVRFGSIERAPGSASIEMDAIVSSPSDGEVPPDEVVGEIADRARRDGAAAIEDREATRHAARERQLLLDEQDGHALIAEPRDDVADLRDDVRLDPFGRL